MLTSKSSCKTNTLLKLFFYKNGQLVRQISLNWCKRWELCEPKWRVPTSVELMEGGGSELIRILEKETTSLTAVLFVDLHRVSPKIATAYAEWYFRICMFYDKIVIWTIIDSLKAHTLTFSGIWVLLSKLLLFTNVKTFL